MPDRFKILAAGFTLGAGTVALLTLLAKSGSVKDRRTHWSQAYQNILLESAQAAESRRQELREHFATLITPPEESLAP